MSIEFLHNDPTLVEQPSTPMAPCSYETLLVQYGLACREEGLYFQVGELELTQGWVIHISVILPQLEDFLHATIPTLKKQQVVFRIIRDIDIAYANLNGHLGPSHLGKIVALFPKNHQEARTLIHILSPITRMFSAPAIPTDFSLGANLYIRYGCHRGIEIKNGAGQKE